MSIQGSTRVEPASRSRHVPLFAAAFVVALVASPVLAIYELILGVLGALLALLLPTSRDSPTRLNLLIVSAAVAAAGLAYVVAGLAMNLWDPAASGEGGSSKPPPG